MFLNKKTLNTEKAKNFFSAFLFNVFSSIYSLLRLLVLMVSFN
tara:strand:- start:4620 stop:4748 length:129 start_codon:yes stop_codon:yes gene_type:complete